MALFYIYILHFNLKCRTSPALQESSHRGDSVGDAIIEKEKYKKKKHTDVSVSCDQSMGEQDEPQVRKEESSIKSNTHESKFN